MMTDAERWPHWHIKREGIDEALSAFCEDASDAWWWAGEWAVDDWSADMDEDEAHEEIVTMIAYRARLGIDGKHEIGPEIGRWECRLFSGPDGCSADDIGPLPAELQAAIDADDEVTP